MSENLRMRRQNALPCLILATSMLIKEQKLYLDVILWNHFAHITCPAFLIYRFGQYSIQGSCGKKEMVHYFQFLPAQLVGENSMGHRLLNKKMDLSSVQIKL